MTTWLRWAQTEAPGLILLAAALVFLLLAGCATPPPPPTKVMDLPVVEYVACKDGDTCTFRLPSALPLLGRVVTVRLAGIQAPETSRPACEAERVAGEAAAKVLRMRLAQARTVALRDAHGGTFWPRIVARVEADGVDVGALLVDRGLAVAWDGRGKKPRAWCGERRE